MKSFPTRYHIKKGPFRCRTDPGNGTSCQSFSSPLVSIRSTAISQYPGSISIPIPLRWHFDAATSVEPLPMNGSNTVSPTNEKSFMHRRGSSTGNGAGWPVFFFLSPLNVHSPLVQSMNSFRLISDTPDPLVFFHDFL